MRAIMIAMMTTATLGLAATSTTVAAPASGNAIVGAAATSEALVQKAQFSRRSTVTRCRHRAFSRRVCETIRRHR
jgi:hypothetical protein